MNEKKLINVPRILFLIGTDVLIKGKIVSLKVLDDRFVENVVKLDYGEQIIAPNDAIYVEGEPGAGNADEAPRYVKNILARLRELPLHDREVWLKAIMGEFEKDFSHAKWREGYEQGKFEGAWVGNQLKGADKIRRELNQVKVPQFVAEIIEYYKGQNATLYDALREKNFNKQYNEWLMNEQDAYDKVARAWLDGYEVEKEKRYLVKVKGVNGYGCYLNKGLLSKEYFFESKNEIGGCRTKHTRKQLEDDDFGWVFDCPGIEIEEVE
ncbi:TPA: DUF1642 domain-containing protein [Streptococcus pneumoniae]